MSAQPTNQTAPDTVNIEIDGKPMQAPKGSMIIHAADKAGIPIPRFCYHEKLPIAANCRMCLVDVEKMPKPAPACATPVMEGMKVTTQTKRALDAQREALKLLRAFGGGSTDQLLGKKWAAKRFAGVYLRNALWEAGYAVDTMETAVDWPRVTSTMRAMEDAGRNALAALGGGSPA